MEKQIFDVDGNVTPLKQHPAQITLSILAVDDVTAEDTLRLLVKHFGRFSDLVNVEGYLA